MKLQGNTRLELLRDGKVVHRVEKHNVISPWLQKAIREGDFGAGIDRNKIMPLTQWFSGCILTDKVNCKSNTDPGFFGMINQDSNVVAMAGDDAYTGTNTRRGSADLSAGATGPITNGYRWTWNWSESYGNGDINSVCLTRANLGKLHYVETGDLDYETDPTLAKTYINESLSNGTLDVAEEVRQLTVIDYEHEIGYKVWYEGTSSSGDIKVAEYALNTKRLHLTGASLGVRELIATHSITMSAGVKDYSLSTATVMFTGNKLHLITFPTGNGKVNDYVIDPTDYSSISATYERNYSDIEFKGFSNTFSQYEVLTKDGMWIEYEDVGGVSTPFLYAVAEVSGTDKIVKCNLTNDSSVTEVATCPTQPDYQGIWIGLPNGDRIKCHMQGTDALLYHNNRWYRTTVRDHHILGTHLQGIHGGDSYGVNLFKLDTNRPDSTYYDMSIDAMFGWVSTVNNLQTTVSKNPGLTMRLIYEITEV